MSLTYKKLNRAQGCYHWNDKEIARLHLSAESMKKVLSQL